MSAIVNNALAGATITYNDVQFGGSDSDHQSVPPTYRISGRFVYDDARTTVVKTDYILNVSTTFYHTTEAGLAAIMEDVRLRLAQPGKTLKIEGLGTAFGTIEHDEEWGPSPQGFEWMPLGQLAMQVSWTVKFSIKECDGHSSNSLSLAAFNFSTTWQNDYEGICERTISGYAEIPVYRIQGGNIAAQVSDQVRDSLNVLCPNGFRRAMNVWQEVASKNRLTFVIVDHMQPGTEYPVGCTHADGSFSYSSQGPGFARATATLNMSLKTSPAYPPSLAGTIFLTAAATKQQQMVAGIGRGTVIPNAIHITNGKFDRARETSASMSWLLTKCTADMMTAAGIWKPLVDTGYNQWRMSVENLWNNRGAASVAGSIVGSDPSEVVIVNLCSGISDATVGQSNVEPFLNNNGINFQFACYNIPEDGGWVYHDLKIRILRQNNQTWHRKAVPYEPTPGYDPGTQSPGETGSGVSLGSFPYTQTTDSESDVEYNGLPTVWVLLQFRGVRVQHKPEMPVITTIAGLPVHEVTAEIDGPNWAFDSLACPVWAIRGYRVYRLNGYVPSVKAQESKGSCVVPDGDKKEY